MSQQTINLGAAPDDGTGDPLRTGGQKINDNFTEIYALKESVANKSPDVTLSGSSNTLYPSQLAIKTYVSTSIAGKEDVTNKSTDGTLSSNSDTLYPSQKAVKTYVDAHTGSNLSVANEISNYDGWAIEFFEDYSTGSVTLNQGVGWDGTGTGSNHTIISRTASNSKTEKRLSLSAGEYARKFYWGSDWIRIQMAVLVRVSGSSTFTGEFRMGVCSDITNTYTSSTCTNWVGLSTLTGNNNSFTFATGSRNNTFTSVFSGAEGKRNNTIISSSSGVGSAGRVISATEAFRHVVFLDITRGPTTSQAASSTSYTFIIRWTDSTSGEYNCGKKQFLQLISDTNFFNWFSAGQTVTFAWSEVPGLLNAMNMNWSNVANTLEVCAVATRKLQ